MKLNRRRGRISTPAYLAVLLVLAGAAAAAAFYLYFYLPSAGLESELEITARAVALPRTAPIQSRVKYTFSSDELKRRLISEIVVPKRASRPKAAPKPTPPLLPLPPLGRPQAKLTPPTVPMLKIPPDSEPEAKPSPGPESGERSPAPVWVLNVISTEMPEKARRFVEILQKTSYRVYSYRVEGEKASWYRVRVGFFSTRQEAEAAAAFLVKEYQMPQAWILTPAPMEVARYFRNQSSRPDRKLLPADHQAEQDERIDEFSTPDLH